MERLIPINKRRPSRRKFLLFGLLGLLFPVLYFSINSDLSEPIPEEFLLESDLPVNYPDADEILVEAEQIHDVSRAVPIGISILLASTTEAFHASPSTVDSAVHSVPRSLSPGFGGGVPGHTPSINITQSQTSSPGFSTSTFDASSAVPQRPEEGASAGQPFASSSCLL